MHQRQNWPSVSWWPGWACSSNENNEVSVCRRCAERWNGGRAAPDLQPVWSVGVAVPVESGGSRDGDDSSRSGSETRADPTLGFSGDGLEPVHHLLTFSPVSLHEHLSRQKFSRTGIVVWWWTRLACNSHGTLFDKTSTLIFPWMAEGMPSRGTPWAFFHPLVIRLSVFLQPGGHIICGERYPPSCVVPRVFRLLVRLIPVLEYKAVACAIVASGISTFAGYPVSLYTYCEG